MVCLDEIDVLILKHLLNNGRKRFTSIAKECNTSTDLISKHFHNLTRSGVIVGATIQKNYPLFGQNLSLLLINTLSQNIEATFKEMQKIAAIHSPFRMHNSPYNIGIISIQSDLENPGLLSEVVKRKFQIVENKLCFFIDVRNMPENLSLGFSQPCKFAIDTSNFRGYAYNEKPKLDELDIKIINELERNGRTPFSKIAKITGSSTDTVNRRYKKLLNNGFIKVSIQINPILLGYKAVAFYFITFFSEKEIEKAIDTISSIPDVSFLIKASGGCDLIVCTLLRDFDDVFRINQELQKIDNIGRIESGMLKGFASWPFFSQHMSTF